jgi:hypothetical protein
MRIDLDRQVLQGDKFYNLLAHFMVVGPVGQTYAPLVGLEETVVDQDQAIEPNNNLQTRSTVQRGSEYFHRYSYTNQTGYLKVNDRGLTAPGTSDFARLVGAVGVPMHYENPSITFRLEANPFWDENTDQQWSIDSIPFVTAAPPPVLNEVKGGICAEFDGEALDSDSTQWFGINSGSSVSTEGFGFVQQSGEPQAVGWLDQGVNVPLEGEIRFTARLDISDANAWNSVQQIHFLVMPQGVGTNAEVYSIPVDRYTSGSQLVINSGWVRFSEFNVFDRAGVVGAIDYKPLDPEAFGDGVILGIGLVHRYQRKDTPPIDPVTVMEIPTIIVERRSCVDGTENAFLTYRQSYIPERFEWVKFGSRNAISQTGIGLNPLQTSINENVDQRTYGGLVFSNTVQEVDHITLSAGGFGSGIVGWTTDTVGDYSPSMIYADVTLGDDVTGVSNVYFGVAQGDNWFLVEASGTIQAGATLNGMIDLFGQHETPPTRPILASSSTDASLFASTATPGLATNTSFVVMFQSNDFGSPFSVDVKQVRWLPGQLRCAVC